MVKRLSALFLCGAAAAMMPSNVFAQVAGHLDGSLVVYEGDVLVGDLTDKDPSLNLVDWCQQSITDGGSFVSVVVSGPVQDFELQTDCAGEWMLGYAHGGGCDNVIEVDSYLVLDRPTELSAFTISPRRARVGQPVAFSLVALEPCSNDVSVAFFVDNEDVDSDPPTFPATNLGGRLHGQPISVPEQPHSYTLAGTRVVTVIITDLITGDEILRITDQVIIDPEPEPDDLDTDGDGIPDAVEVSYRLNPYDPGDALIDHDNDGITTGDEYANGTPPFFPNTPPAPTIVSPTNGSVVDALPLTAIAAAVDDPDGDAVTYTFAFYNDESFTTAVLTQAGVTATGANVELTVDAGLPPSQRYYVRVRGCDPIACGAWSNAVRFALDAENAPPTQPTPLRPFGVVETLDLTTFSWLASREESGESFTYQVRLLQDGAFAGEFNDIDGAQTSLTVNADLSDNTRYAWQIRAIDSRGGASEWSAELGFVANSQNQAPAAPTLISPEQDEQRAGRAQTFVVENGTDPDGDELRMVLQFDDEPSFSDAAELIVDADPSGRTTASYAFTGSANPQYWRARMSDGSRLSEPTPGQFVLRLSNAPPYAPELISPEDGTDVGTRTPELLLSDVGDIDGDGTTITIEIYADATLAEAVGRYSGVTSTGGTVAFVVPDRLADGGTFYWRARAFDTWNAVSADSTISQFTVIATNRPPSAPSTLVPNAASIAAGTVVVLESLNGADDDGDELSYFYEVYEDVDGVQGRLIESGTDVQQGQGGVSRYAMQALLEVGSYSWRVRAFDGTDYSPWSSSAVFAVYLIESDTGGCGCSSTRTGGSASALFIFAALLVRRRRRNE